MSCDEGHDNEGTPFRVSGFMWVQVASGQWRSLLLRSCTGCGEFDVTPLHRIDADHAFCWHCLSQELQFVGEESTPELQVWQCILCHNHTRIQVTHD